MGAIREPRSPQLWAIGVKNGFYMEPVPVTQKLMSGRVAFVTGHSASTLLVPQ